MYNYGYKNAAALWRNIKRKSKNISNPVYIFNTPNYFNLGDHAIYVAERLLLEKLFGKRIIGVSDEVLDLYKDKIIDIIPQDSIIFFTGGGNIGTLWLFVEERLRWLVNNFRKNKIICFPNTAYYDNNLSGNLELNKSISCFTKHKNILFCWREQYSAQFFKDKFFNLSFIVAPDMAFYLALFYKNFLYKLYSKQTKCVNVLIMLRNDREQVFSNKTVVADLKSAFMIQFSDMADVNKKIYTYQQSVREIKRKLTEIASAKIVITDRLHGIIFSLLVGTPCLVVNSLSHKIKGTIELIKQEIPNICLDYLDESKPVVDQVEMLCKKECVKINFNDISKLYDALLKEMKVL